MKGGVGAARSISAAISLMTILSLSMVLVAPLAPSAYAATTTTTTSTTTPKPTTFYVSTIGSDTTGTGSAGNPFATISHAVSTATSGMTVIVEPGTYKEMVLLTTKLTLVSQNSQPSNTVINATGQLVGIAVVGSAAAGSVVEGFTVMNSNNEGVLVQDSSNVMIENNFVTHNALNVLPGLGEAKGIQLTGTSDSTVAGNTVVSNLYGGIGVADDGPIDPSWNATAAPSAGIPAGAPHPGDANLISGNVVTHNRPNHCAIVISSYNSGEGVANNIISSNTVVDNQDGVIVAADSPNTKAINNTVMYNNILNNGEGGVVVHSNTPGDVVTGNSIVNNVISGNGYLPILVGIIVGGEGPVAVQDTSIIGNVFQNEAVAVQIVNGMNTMVGGNTIGATVQLGYNGTVTEISTSSAVLTVTLTTTTTSTLTQITTNTHISTASESSTAAATSSSGELTFSLALLTAVGTLIVGLIAGIIVRPIRGASGR